MASCGVIGDFKFPGYMCDDDAEQIDICPASYSLGTFSLDFGCLNKTLTIKAVNIAYNGDDGDAEYEEFYEYFDRTGSLYSCAADFGSSNLRVLVSDPFGRDVNIDEYYMYKNRIEHFHIDCYNSKVNVSIDSLDNLNRSNSYGYLSCMIAEGLIGTGKFACDCNEISGLSVFAGDIETNLGRDLSVCINCGVLGDLDVTACGTVNLNVDYGAKKDASLSIDATAYSANQYADVNITFFNEEFDVSSSMYSISAESGTFSTVSSVKIYGSLSVENMILNNVNLILYKGDVVITEIDFTAGSYAKKILASSLNDTSITIKSGAIEASQISGNVNIENCDVSGSSLLGMTISQPGGTTVSFKNCRMNYKYDIKCSNYTLPYGSKLSIYDSDFRLVDNGSIKKFEIDDVDSLEIKNSQMYCELYFKSGKANKVLIDSSTLSKLTYENLSQMSSLEIKNSLISDRFYLISAPQSLKIVQSTINVSYILLQANKYNSDIVRNSFSYKDNGSGGLYANFKDLDKEASKQVLNNAEFSSSITSARFYMIRSMLEKITWSNDAKASFLYIETLDPGCYISGFNFKNVKDLTLRMPKRTRMLSDYEAECVSKCTGAIRIYICNNDTATVKNKILSYNPDANVAVYKLCS